MLCLVNPGAMYMWVLQVSGLVCELSPGDTLLVPAYWFMHSQLQQPACVALVIHLQPLPSKLLDCNGLLLQLSRMIECWVGAEVGTANIRQWLMVRVMMRATGTVDSTLLLQQRDLHA